MVHVAACHLWYCTLCIALCEVQAVEKSRAQSRRPACRGSSVTQGWAWPHTTLEQFVAVRGRSPWPKARCAAAGENVTLCSTTVDGPGTGPGVSGCLALAGLDPAMRVVAVRRGALEDARVHVAGVVSREHKAVLLLHVEENRLSLELQRGLAGLSSSRCSNPSHSTWCTVTPFFVSRYSCTRNSADCISALCFTQCDLSSSGVYRS